MNGEEKTEPKYSEIEVDWSNIDGNAYILLGSVSRAMRRARIPPDEIEKFRDEAQSDDYNHLIQTCMKWVTIVFESKEAERE